jgi:hypothetical protein
VIQRLVDVHGEGRFDVLGDRGLVGGDGDLDQVAFVAWSTWLVGNGGADRGFVQGQLLELADIRASTVAIDLITGSLVPV